MARGGGRLIDVDAVLFLGIIAGAFIYRNQIIEFIQKLPSDFGVAANVNSTNIYPLTGRRCGCISESQTIGCGGGNSPSLRVNCNNCQLINYEATARLQFGGGCGCGNEATIKHYGPGHQDGNCCWAMSVVNQDGTTAFGGEGPHGGTTDKSQMKLKSFGSMRGRVIGIKSIIWRQGSGAHQELYIDPSGSMRRWQRAGTRNISSWGDAKKTNRVASNQQVEFRVDCSGARWLSYSVAEIRR